MATPQEVEHVSRHHLIIDQTPKLKFELVDVGGQRSERKKWIQCFDNVTAGCLDLQVKSSQTVSGSAGSLKVNIDPPFLCSPLHHLVERLQPDALRGRDDKQNEGEPEAL